MTTGLFIGLMGFVGNFMLWKSMPRAVKMWTLNHPIITDIITGVVVYWTISIFSKSIACMVASVTAPFLMQCTLWLIDKYGRESFGLIEDDTPIVEKMASKVADMFSAKHRKQKQKN